jgi:hemin uptake protein HemP
MCISLTPICPADSGKNWIFLSGEDTSCIHVNKPCLLRCSTEHQHHGTPCSLIWAPRHNNLSIWTQKVDLYPAHFSLTEFGLYKQLYKAKHNENSGLPNWAPRSSLSPCSLQSLKIWAPRYTKTWAPTFSKGQSTYHVNFTRGIHTCTCNAEDIQEVHSLTLFGPDLVLIIRHGKHIKTGGYRPNLDWILAHGSYLHITCMYIVD